MGISDRDPFCKAICFFLLRCGLTRSMASMSFTITLTFNIFVSTSCCAGDRKWPGSWRGWSTRKPRIRGANTSLRFCACKQPAACSGPRINSLSWRYPKPPLTYSPRGNSRVEKQDYPSCGI